VSNALETVRYIAQNQVRIQTLKDTFKAALIAHAAVSPNGSSSSIRAVHDAAVDYFSSIEEWVASMSLLPGLTRLALLSLAESCIAALNSYLNYWDFLGREGAQTGLGLQAQYGPAPAAELYPQMQAMVAIHYPKRGQQIRQGFADRGLPTSGFEDPKYLNEVRQMTERANAGTTTNGGAMTALKWVAVAFSVVFLAALLFLVVFIPNPTGLQILVFRVLLALCAAVIAGALIGGFIELKGKLAQFSLSAGGAAAFFLIVYLFNPPELLTQPSAGESAAAEQTEAGVGAN